MRAILLIFVVAISIVIGAGNPVPEPRKLKTTSDRVKEHGYPVEEHTVQTGDSYILKMFRIPYSPKLQNQNVRPKPVVFLMHGLFSSSDSWIISGPDNALAYLLADAGYDVWMGNARGNAYSKKHVTLSPLFRPFWDFSWHGIGLYDLPAMIDYVLDMTHEHTLHYVGHSQGTTAFMVLLSSIPRYNQKIKTSHMLAPVGYMNHLESPLAKASGLLGYSSILSDLFGSNEFLPNSKFLPEPRKLKTTSDRIKEHGYPVEEHTVQTGDSYILKMFRIPYSPKLQNQNVRPKPVVFLMHGLLSSSDCWILNGPDNALPFMLADAGYDVWMGNARGNTYSRKHLTLSPLLPPFWDFSWNEIGLYDLPAMIDYVLDMTHEDTLHYVGHSQGTTAFMVLLSSIPRYNQKIKTSHMLAPVGYMNHQESPLAKASGFLGYPSILSDLFGSNEFLPNDKFLSLLGSEACANESVFQPICVNILFLVGGWKSSHLNYTLLPDVGETHPAGCSSSQVVHYLQEYKSGYFRKYDFGLIKNQIVYDSTTPPEYFVENISPDVPLEFYYSDNDNLASVIDVKRMAKRLGKNVRLYHIKYSDWNHLDFLFAIDIKEVINDRILSLVNKYEGRN